MQYPTVRKNHADSGFLYLVTNLKYFPVVALELTCPLEIYMSFLCANDFCVHALAIRNGAPEALQQRKRCGLCGHHMGPIQIHYQNC
jgi:uncharacterized CHY-type Zn-finger protein